MQIRQLRAVERDGDLEEVLTNLPKDHLELVEMIDEDGDLQADNVGVQVDLVEGKIEIIPDPMSEIATDGGQVE